VVTGQRTFSAAAKALKNFAAEFDKLKSSSAISTTSAWKRRRLSRWRICRAWTFCAPPLPGPAQRAGGRSWRFWLNTPATMLAQVIKGEVRKGLRKPRLEALKKRNAQSKRFRFEIGNFKSENKQTTTT